MKIAYCISGHLRTFAKNNTLRRNLLGHYPGDVYAHTYPVYNASGPMWHSDRRGCDQRVTASDLDLFRGMFEPVAMEVDAKTCGAEHLTHADKMAFRWSRARAHELRIASGRQYDLVIDIRPDLVLDERFVLPLEIEPNTFHGTYNLTSIEQGIDGEVYSFATPRVMDAIMTPAIPDWLTPTEIARYGFCGEQLVTDIRLHHKIAYKTHRMRCGLLRSSGAVEWIRI